MSERRMHGRGFATLAMVAACVGVVRGAADFTRPYGVNSWWSPSSVYQRWQQCGMKRYRVMVNWRTKEPADDTYNWTAGTLTTDLQGALDHAAANGIKLSLCVFDSPDWARSNPSRVMSYSPVKYADFVIALLDYCEARAPGVVEAVEVENEHPTGATYPERDPSRYYIDILKETYRRVKAYNSNILVIMDGIWGGAYHHLDDIYQLGGKGYFDRTNVHYYTEDYVPGQTVQPTDINTIWHYATTMRYLWRMAEDYEDYSAVMWLTEFGWRQQPENIKADWIIYTLDQSRKLGFVEKAEIYVGLSGGYPGGYDRMGLIYTDNDNNPSFLQLTTSYYHWQAYASSYPAWGLSHRELVPTVAPASRDVAMVNPGFESGTAEGWSSYGTIDATVKHSGRYSMRQVSTNSITTQLYTVEPGRLYEVTAWAKVDAPNPDTYYLWLAVGEFRTGTMDSQWPAPPNYYGVYDTRYYPKTWRRLRFLHRIPDNVDRIVVAFSGSGSTNGTFWIDDVSIRSLSFGLPIVSTGTLPNPPANLRAAGNPSPAQVSVSNPVLSWTFSDPDVGDMQAAYEVLVSTSWQNFLWNEGEQFATGKVMSAVSQCTYAGAGLYQGPTYYWKVKVWDNTGLSSRWSSGTFTYVPTGTPGTAARLGIILPKTDILAETESVVAQVRVLDAAGNTVPQNTTANVTMLMGTATVGTATVPITNGIGFHTLSFGSAMALGMAVSASGLSSTGTLVHVLVNRDITTVALSTPDAGGTTAVFPYGTLSGHRRFTTRVLSGVEADLGTLGTAVAGSGRELTARDPATGTAEPQTAYRAPVTVTMRYSDDDGDGMVDGSGLPVRRLKVFVRREATGQWETGTDMVVSTGARTVRATVPFLGRVVLGVSREPTDLLVDNRPSPAVIDVEFPVFFWTNGVPVQSAFQVLLSSVPARLAPGLADWDTGKTASTAPVVMYSGPEFVSGTTYYWRVRVWDSSDVVTAYSDVASFRYQEAPAGAPAKLGLSVPKLVASSSETVPVQIRILDAAGRIVRTSSTTASLRLYIGNAAVTAAIPVSVSNGVGSYTLLFGSATYVRVRATAPGLEETNVYMTFLINQQGPTYGISDLDTGRTRVLFPAGTFTANRTFRTRVVLDSAIQVGDPRKVRLVSNSGKEIWVEDPAAPDVPVSTAAYLRQPVVYLPYYNDLNGDGRIDSDTSLLVEWMKVYQEDPVTGEWRELPGSAVNTTQRYVSAPAPYLTRFAIGVKIPVREVRVSQNYPNPFDPRIGPTTIEYDVPATTEVNITMYSVSGQVVRTLVSRRQVAGPAAYTVEWDGRNDGGDVVSTGIYLCHVSIGGDRYIRKIAVIKGNR